MDWRVLLYAFCLMTLIRSTSSYRSYRSATSKDDRSVHLRNSSEEEDVWSGIRSKFKRITESMTRGLQESIADSLIGGAKSRGKRESAFQFHLLRDDKGVAVADKLVNFGTIGGKVHSSLQLNSQILVASSKEENIVISTFDLRTLQESEIARFPGTGSCGFAQPLGRILIACGPVLSSVSGIAEDVRVTVRELVNIGVGYRIEELQPVFRRNLLSSTAWKQDADEYWLLAGRYEANSTEGSFRNSNRFLSMKSPHVLNFDAAIHVYRWVAHRYDLVETVSAQSPSEVVHFLVNNFHFFVVAEGKQGFPSAVYRYSLDLERYVMLQRLQTPGGALGVTVFTLGLSVEKDTFLALAFQCPVRCKNDHTVVIFKYTKGKFLPFQALAVPFPRAIKALQTKDGVLLVVAGDQGGLHFYQYGGWRFVAVTPHGYKETDLILDVIPLSSGPARSLIAVNVESRTTRKAEAAVYEVQYSTKTPFKDYYSSLSGAVQKSLRASGVARSVMRLAEEAPKVNEAFSFRSPVTFLRNLDIESMTANKVYSESEELPSTVDDSFRKLNLLQQKLALLRHKQLKLVSVNSSEKWPRTLRASSISILGNSSVSALRVRKTVNGFTVPSESALVPILTSESFRVPSLQFNEVAVEGDLTVQKLNNVPFGNYVTLAGDHNIDASVTFLGTLKADQIHSMGSVNGHRVEDFLTRSAPQNLTGNFKCKLGRIERLNADNINNVAMPQLFETAISQHSDALIKGSLFVAKNVTCKKNLHAGSIFGVDLDAFASQVLLKRSPEPQVIPGLYHLENIATTSLKVRGLVNNVPTDDLYINRRGLTHALESANFMNLSAEQLTITGSLNDITVGADGSLDILLLNKNQTVNGAKVFRGLHLSDVYDENDKLEDSSTIPPQETLPTTLGFDAERTASLTKLSSIESKISILNDVLEKLEDLLSEISFERNTSGRGYLNLICISLISKLNEADTATDMTSWKSETMRMINDCLLLVNKLLILKSSPILSQVLNNLVEKLYLERERILETIRILRTEEQALKITMTTEASPVTQLDSNTQRLSELQNLRIKLSTLERELSELVAQQKVGSNKIHHSHGLSFSTRPIRDNNENSTSISFNVLERIRRMEIQRANLLQSISRLEPFVLGVPSGKKGSGSYVYGRVAGENLGELNRLLQSLTPSEVEQQDFLRYNSSLISKMEFRSDLSIDNLNGMDIRNLQRQILPIETQVLPFGLKLTKETEVTGDLSTAFLNRVPTRNFLTLQRDHTLFQKVTFKSEVHSKSNVDADLVNNINLSREQRFLAKTNESQVFDHNVSFALVNVPSLLADSIEVSGVNFEDALLKNVNSTLSGINNFASMLVLSETEVSRLQTPSINSIEVNKLFNGTVRKKARTEPQRISGTKFFNALESRRNVDTKGFSSSSLSGDRFASPLYNLTWLSENAFKLDKGGSLKNLRVSGGVEFKSLTAQGLIDGVKFPGNWLRSEGEQNFTAPTTYFTTLNAEEVYSSGDSLLDTLLVDTIKINKPYTFKDKVAFDKFITSSDFKVNGTVQGLSVPDDLVSKSESNVLVAGVKFFSKTVKSFVEVLDSVNGVKVDKLCDANTLNTLTVAGDSIFDAALLTPEIKTGKHIISGEVMKNFWNGNVFTVLPGDFTFRIVNTPTIIKTEKINGRRVEEIFQSRLNRSCHGYNISTNWSFDRLTVDNAVAQNVQADVFQDIPSIELGDILLKNTDQFIPEVHSVESVRARDLTVFGSVNGVQSSSFCTSVRPCVVKVPKHFERNVTVQRDVHILPGSAINGIIIRDEAANVVQKSTGGFIPGVTTVVGNVSTRSVRADLVDGKPFTRRKLFTKSDHRVIKTHFIVVSKKEPAVQAFETRTGDFRFSNYSVFDIFDNSVLRTTSGQLVIEGKTFFDGAVTFYRADSAFTSPKIGPPEDLALLRKDFSVLQEALKVGNLSNEDRRFSGWDLVQEIGEDYHKVVHLGNFIDGESYLALIPWRGDAEILRYQDGKFERRGIRLQGSCISDVKAWAEGKEVYFVVSDVCTGVDAANGEDVSAGWRVDLLIHNITLPVLHIAGGVPRGAFVLNNGQDACIGLLSTSSSVLPVVCKEGTQYSLRQNLPVERPVQALPFVFGNSTGIITASLGKSPYGGSLDVWRYNESLLKYTLQNTVSEPGICSIATAPGGSGRHIASVSRHFKGHQKAVSVYRYSEETREFWLFQRFSLPSAREVEIVNSPVLNQVMMFVLTTDGDVHRYTAGPEERFQKCGKLQARHVINFASWIFPEDEADVPEDSGIFLGVVEKSSLTDRQRGNFALYKTILFP